MLEPIPMKRLQASPRLTFACLLILCTTLGVHAQSDTIASIDDLFVRTLRNKTISADSLILIGNQLQTASDKLRFAKGVTRGKIISGLGFLYSNQLDQAAQSFINAINDTQLSDAGSFEEGLSH